MTVKEFFEKINNIKDELLDEYWAVGIRFEEKERQVGDIITDKSRHNNDREDERDFPEYGTDEYFEMQEFDGVSAWEIEGFERAITPSFQKEEFLNSSAKQAFMATHCYIIASDDVSNTDDDLDVGEVVLVDPIVKKVMF